MKTRTLILLCGLPGSGKTTLAKQMGTYHEFEEPQEKELSRFDINHTLGDN